MPLCGRIAKKACGWLIGSTPHSEAAAVEVRPTVAEVHLGAAADVRRQRILGVDLDAPDGPSGDPDGCTPVVIKRIRLGGVQHDERNGPDAPLQAASSSGAHILGLRHGDQRRKIHFHPVNHIHLHERVGAAICRCGNPGDGTWKADRDIIRVLSRCETGAAIAIQSSVLARRGRGGGGAVERCAGGELPHRSKPFGVNQHIHSARDAGRVGRILSGLAVKPQVRHIHSQADKAQEECRHADHHEDDDLAAVLTSAAAGCDCQCVNLVRVFHGW